MRIWPYESHHALKIEAANFFAILTSSNTHISLFLAGEGKCGYIYNVWKCFFEMSVKMAVGTSCVTAVYTGAILFSLQNV